MTRLRLFAAVKIHPSPDLLNIYYKLKSGLKYEKIKWVEEENFHVTLKFFGETPEDKIPGIINELKEAAINSQSFQLYLENTKIFGSSYKPKIVWFGINPCNELQQLHANIQKQLLNIGYEPGSENFVSHLTIGRIKYIQDKNFFQKIIDEYKKTSIQTVEVKKFYLFESILRKEGPVYRVIDTFDLNSPSHD